jgi:hypothetical protein
MAGRWAGGSLQDLQDGGDKPGGPFGDVLTEQVCALDRCEGAAATEVTVGDGAVIEPDRNKPWDVWAAQPELVDGKDEFLVLVALVAAQAAVGEASDEGQGVIGYRTPYVRPPVLAGPQAGCIPPHRDARSLKCPLQLIDVR